jgi:hypothetical protein
MYSAAVNNIDTELRRRRAFKATNFLPTGWNMFQSPGKSAYGSEKQEHRKNVRVFMGYIVLFLMGATTLALMQYLRSPTLANDSDFLSLSHWHQSVSKARHEDMINHHYNNMVVSILLPEADFENDSAHPSITTFLQQIQYLQICNEHIAHTYRGGKKCSSIPFFAQVPELPRLERYIDAYLSMLEFAPDQEWFMQIDQGMRY